MALLLVLLIPKASARTPIRSCYTVLVSCLVDLNLMNKYLLKIHLVEFHAFLWVVLEEEHGSLNYTKHLVYSGIKIGVPC